MELNPQIIKLREMSDQYAKKLSKKEPVDEQLKLLRGFAVEIKSPTQAGDTVRRIQDVREGGNMQDFGMTGQSGKMDMLPNIHGGRG